MQLLKSNFLNHDRMRYLNVDFRLPGLNPGVTPSVVEVEAAEGLRGGKFSVGSCNCFFSLMAGWPPVVAMAGASWWLCSGRITSL